MTGRHTGLTKFGELLCAGMNSAVRKNKAWSRVVQTTVEELIFFFFLVQKVVGNGVLAHYMYITPHFDGSAVQARRGKSWKRTPSVPCLYRSFILGENIHRHITCSTSSGPQGLKRLIVIQIHESSLHQQILMWLVLRARFWELCLAAFAQGTISLTLRGEMHKASYFLLWIKSSPWLWVVILHAIPHSHGLTIYFAGVRHHYSHPDAIKSLLKRGNALWGCVQILRKKKNW